MPGKKHNTNFTVTFPDQEAVEEKEVNYLTTNKNNFLSDYDAGLIECTPSLDILTDAALQIFDELNRSSDQFKDLLDVNTIPDELINHLSSVVGWRQTDYQFNFLTYRDLVKSIVSIYKIKGTKLSYDVFFRAFGYVPDVKELWWNADGELVDTKPIGAPDPSQTTRKLNRSNYLQIEIDLLFDDPSIPNPFSNQQFTRVILEYLKFLKPVHIKYKPIQVNIPGFTEEPVIVEEACPIFILGSFPSDLTPGSFEDVIEGEIVDEMDILGLYNTEDCPILRYDNTIYYGDSVARNIEVDGKQYPISVIQRQATNYGDKCAPIPDEFRITFQFLKEFPPEQFELRYSNYIFYNNQASFNPENFNDIEIVDYADYDSEEFSYGPGTLL